MVMTGRSVGRAEREHLGRAQHRAVVGDELADGADGREPGEAAQVDGGLGVPGRG